jgi:hypothetical protein
MPSSGDLLAFSGGVVALLISWYAAYWAFNFRRGLAIRLCEIRRSG